MEDYKKKYEQALGRAKNYREGHTLDVNPKSAMEYVFPELKESEDERIRKEIIQFLQLPHHQFVGKRNHEEWIAWLEKQGEHANFRNKIQIGDEVTRNEDGMLVNLSQFKRVVKQGEQKSTDKVEPKFKVGDVMRTPQEAADGFTDGMPVVVYIDDEYYHCTNALIAIKNQDDYEYPPRNRWQKPAWSEEDENYENTLISLINEIKNKPLIRLEDWDCYIDWLKYIKERIQSQPKREWGEEDKMFLEKIISDYTAASKSFCGHQGKLDWLKSLKERMKGE